ncbi:MFS transporter [soil metagenome]
MARISGGRAFVAVIFAFVLMTSGVLIPTPMYGTYQEKFGFTVATSTVIYAVYSLGVLIALLVFGRWSDTLGRRPILLAGLTIALISHALYFSAESTSMLLVARILSGMSTGVFVGAATASVIELATPTWRERAPLVTTIINIIGPCLGPLVTAILMDALPWDLRLPFVVYGVLTAAAIVLVIFLPETVMRRPGARPQFQRPTVPAAARKAFAVASVACFAGFAITGLMAAVSPQFVARAIDNPSHVVQVLVVVLIFASSVIGQVAFQGFPTQPAIVVGCVLLTVGSLLLVLALATDSFPLMLLASAVTGVGHGAAFSKGLASVLEKVGRDVRAGVTSAFFIVAYLSLSIPVIAEGIAARRWGITPASIAFTSAGAVLAGGALIYLLIEQRRVLTPSIPRL